MKITFIYTDTPDVRALPKDDIYTRNFDLPDSALQIPNCRETILQIADTLSKFTSACLSITCDELKLKNHVVSTKAECSYKIGSNLSTIVLVFASSSGGNHIERRKLHILYRDHSISLTSQSYYEVYGRSSLSRGLLHDETSWASSDQEYENRKVLLSVVEPLLTLLNADSSRQWRFMGFRPLWTDNSLMARRKQVGKRYEKELRRKEREAKKLGALQEREVEKDKPKEDFVYFLQAGETGPIKIGTSQNPRKRIASLRTATAEELRVLKIVKGSKTLETTLHDRFTSIRKRGEWFLPTQELLDFITSLPEVSD